MQKVELLAPAGDMEKLQMAIVYGADAVYFAGKKYGLRAAAGNFSLDEMKEGISLLHSMGKKGYLTMNMIPHNKDLSEIDEYIKRVSEIGVDGVILSDPSILQAVKDINPCMEIHLSTQANNTNWKSAEFWYKQGVKRVVLARELSLEEINEINSKKPVDLELEAFVHGAMCISYSGRCLLSNYMVHRDANQGDCAHPCRWNYHLVEETRPGEYMPVYEDETGTFIFNSKDLCMIKHIPQLIESGIYSFKIEGRMKSSFYVATIVRAYRKAIDEYYNSIKQELPYKYNTEWYDEVSKVSNRSFTTAFFFGKPGKDEQNYGTSSYVKNYDFIGRVLEYSNETGIAVVEQRNRIFKGEDIEIMNPTKGIVKQKIHWMKNDRDELIDVAPHPKMIIKLPVDEVVEQYAMLRREIVVQ